MQCPCRGPPTTMQQQQQQQLQETTTQSRRFLEIPSFARKNRHLSIDRVPELLNENTLKELKFENKESRNNSNLYLESEHIE